MSRSVTTFVVLCYLASYSMAGTIWLTGGPESPYAGLGLLAMLAPLLVVIPVRIVWRDAFAGVQWGAFSSRHALIGLTVIPLVGLVVGALWILANGGELAWASWLTAGADGMIHAPVETGLGGGEPFPAEDLQSQLLTRLVINFPLLCLFVLGEELGWRSFLQTRLTERLGARRAILAVALLWAFWHTGFQLAGVGDEPIGELFFGLVCVATVSMIGVGIFYGWLYHASGGSLWVVVIAHAAGNKWGQLSLRYLEQPDTGDWGMYVVFWAFALVGLWTWRRLGREAPA